MTGSKVGIVYSDNYLKHKSSIDSHPESPSRLLAVKDQLQTSGSLNGILQINPSNADEKDVLLVHDETYLHKLQRLDKKIQTRSWSLDNDTYMAKNSLDVAFLAAGGVCRAVDAIKTKKCIRTFCAVRPPGHHASQSKAGGFCLLNNVAIGARYAQEKHKYGKIMIVDWDIHHGNGTQNIFYSDPSVFYLSIHRLQGFPGTGGEDEKGKGDGFGFNKNVVIPEHIEDNAYLSIFTHSLNESFSMFNPDLIFISAGFDGHKNDPLGDTDLSSSLYGKITTQLKQYAGNTPMISVLEGGYNNKALAESVMEHIVALKS